MTSNDVYKSPAVARAIRANTILFAIVCGLACGLLFFVATLVLVWQGGAHVGEHLSLFAVFLPGYSVTTGGAWIGFFWVALFAGISGAILYGTYARTLNTKLLEQSVSGSDPGDSVLIAPIAKLSGNALGIGLGLMVALQLFISTNWLVLRGTADSSHHAQLVSHFLPGYSVSFVGSVIGAVELFIGLYILCQVLTFIYNAVAARRAGG